MSDWFLDVYVTGEPRAQGSMRHVGNGRLIHSKEMLAWRDKITHTLRQWQGTWFGGWGVIDEPVEVHAEFWLPRPKKPRLEHGATGIDLDKAARCLGDALEQSGTLRNDARIVRWDVRKHWTRDIENEDGHEPGVRIKIRRIE